MKEIRQAKYDKITVARWQSCRLECSSCECSYCPGAM